MNSLKKLTIRNLILNKKRTIVTIIGIILSVALLSALTSLYSSAIKSFINFEVTEKGNFHYAYYNVPVNELATFENNNKISDLYITEDIGYAKIASKNSSKPYAFLKSFTKEALENLSVKLIDGRMPTKSDEILIPSHLKTNGRLVLNIGDTITLDVGTRISSDGTILKQSNPYQEFNPDEKINISEDQNDNITSNNSGAEKIINTTKKTYKIVGIIERPATNIESYTAPGFTFITYMSKPSASKIDIFARYTKKGLKEKYLVTSNLLGINASSLEYIYEHNNTSSDTKYAAALEEVSKAKYKYNENSYLILLETNPLKDNGGIMGLGIVVLIVALIIIFTSVFCIKNSFDISITEKMKLFGMLRSIGATKKQIKKNVFYEAFILALIGIPLGILSGIFAAFILIIVSNYLLATNITGDLKLVFSINIISIILSVILSIITVYLSAFRSAKKASKITPMRAIKSSANITIKKTSKNKLIHALFGIGGDLSYKNLKRSKRKYRTTIISIAVSVTTFIALSSFINLAYKEIKNTYKNTDYNIYFSLDTNGDKELLNQALATTNLDNIENYSIMRNISTRILNPKYSQEYSSHFNSDDLDLDSSYIVTYTLGDHEFKRYLKSLGLDYEENKNKAVLVNRAYDCYYIEKTDKIECLYETKYTYKKNDVLTTGKNTKEGEITLAAVTDKYPFGLSNYTQPVLIVPDSYFDETYPNITRYIFYFYSKKASTLQDDIEALLKNRDFNVVNNEEQVEMMNNLYTLIAIFLYGLIIVITLIGITNIFNTITTNIELRSPEFAMLKSVGMTKNEFNRMIRLESLFMGLKALLFGIPLGLALSYLIYKAFNGDNSLTYELPYLALFLAIISVFLLIFIIMKYSVNKVNKKNTIETIRNENI